MAVFALRLYLWVLKFEFRVIFTHHETLRFFFFSTIGKPRKLFFFFLVCEPYKNRLQARLGPQANISWVQTETIVSASRMAIWICRMDYSQAAWARSILSLKISFCLSLGGNDSHTSSLPFSTAGGLPHGENQATHSEGRRCGSPPPKLPQPQLLTSWVTDPPTFQEWSSRGGAGGLEAGRSNGKGFSTGTRWHLFFGSFFSSSSFSLLVKSRQWHRDAGCPNSWVTDGMFPFDTNFLDMRVRSHICTYVYTRVCPCRKQAVVTVWDMKHSWLQSILGTSIWRGREGGRRQERETSGHSGGPVTETPHAECWNRNDLQSCPRLARTSRSWCPHLIVSLDFEPLGKGHGLAWGSSVQHDPWRGWQLKAYLLSQTEAASPSVPGSICPSVCPSTHLSIYVSVNLACCVCMCTYMCVNVRILVL